jgi:hypothetical protein
LRGFSERVTDLRRVIRKIAKKAIDPTPRAEILKILVKVYDVSRE